MPKCAALRTPGLHRSDSDRITFTALHFGSYMSSSLTEGPCRRVPKGVLLKTLMAVVTVKDLEGSLVLMSGTGRVVILTCPCFVFFILWSQGLGQVTD